jgi:serine/threonine protein kinase
VASDTNSIQLHHGQYAQNLIMPHTSPTIASIATPSSPSQLMRLTVQIGRDKFRIPVESYRTLGWLQSEIIKRWEARHRGEYLNIKEIRTENNIRLDPDDQIIEVCKEDEILIVIISSSLNDIEVQIGDMLMQYYLIELIGEGTFGRVFKAHDLNLNRFVAVKILKKDKQSEINTRRFLREAELNGSLSNNPYIVTVHDFGRTRGGSLYMVMELLKGRPMNELLDEKINLNQPFSALEIIHIISPVLKGLQAAHTHEPRIIHRDLKPDNIWICNEQALKPANLEINKYDHTYSPSSIMQKEREPLIIKLMDFGIAIHDEITHQTLACGTRHYSSPEQMRKNAKIDARSDIWSVGVILYQMVTLLVDVPFDPIEVSLGAEVPHISLYNKSDISHDFQAIIMKAKHKNPSDRCSSAEAMADALHREEAAILSGQTQIKQSLPLSPAHLPNNSISNINPSNNSNANPTTANTHHKTPRSKL